MIVTEVGQSGDARAEFAAALRELRQRIRRSDRWIARKAGVAPSTVNDAMNGRTVPTEDCAQAIVEVCGGRWDVWRHLWLDAAALRDQQKAEAAALTLDRKQQQEVQQAKQREFSRALSAAVDKAETSPPSPAAQAAVRRQMIKFLAGGERPTASGPTQHADIMNLRSRPASG